MEPTKEELLEARENSARLKSLITLANRRVNVFEIAVSLIEKELQ